MNGMNRYLGVILGLALIGGAPTAKAMTMSQMGTGVIYRNVSYQEREIPAAQRVYIRDSAGFSVTGDAMTPSDGSFQPVYLQEDIKRMTIGVTPKGHLKVVTGVPVLEQRPVVFRPMVRNSRTIDVLYDGQSVFNLCEGFGTHTNGQYVPFPQTPDITVNPQLKTIHVDAHR